MCEIGDKDQLCGKIVETFNSTSTTERGVWCILNVPGKVQFPGYDFAYISTEGNSQTTEKQVQLLQATVSPVSHPKQKMVSVRDKIKSVCKSHDAKVEGLFLVPKGTVTSRIAGGFAVTEFDVLDTNQ